MSPGPGSGTSCARLSSTPNRPTAALPPLPPISGPDLELGLVAGLVAVLLPAAARPRGRPARLHVDERAHAAAADLDPALGAGLDLRPPPCAPCRARPPCLPLRWTTSSFFGRAPRNSGPRISCAVTVSPGFASTGVTRRRRVGHHARRDAQLRRRLAGEVRRHVQLVAEHRRRLRARLRHGLGLRHGEPHDAHRVDRRPGSSSGMRRPRTAPSRTASAAAASPRRPDRRSSGPSSTAFAPARTRHISARGSSPLAAARQAVARAAGELGELGRQPGGLHRACSRRWRSASDSSGSPNVNVTAYIRSGPAGSRRRRATSADALRELRSAPAAAATTAPPRSTRRPSVRAVVALAGSSNHFAHGASAGSQRSIST